MVSYLHNKIILIVSLQQIRQIAILLRKRYSFTNVTKIPP